MTRFLLGHPIGLLLTIGFAVGAIMACATLAPSLVDPTQASFR